MRTLLHPVFSLSDSLTFPRGWLIRSFNAMTTECQFWKDGKKKCFSETTCISFCSLSFLWGTMSQQPLMIPRLIQDWVNASGYCSTTANRSVTCCQNSANIGNIELFRVYSNLFLMLKIYYSDLLLHFHYFYYIETNMMQLVVECFHVYVNDFHALASQETDHLKPLSYSALWCECTIRLSLTGERARVWTIDVSFIDFIFVGIKWIFNRHHYCTITDWSFIFTWIKRKTWHLRVVSGGCHTCHKRLWVHGYIHSFRHWHFHS